MAKYVGRPLKALDRLYKFIEGLVTNSTVDLASPIQLVHDVSRNADFQNIEGKFGGLSSRGSPYFTINIDNVHAGASIVVASIGIYSNQSPTWALSDWDAPDGKVETVWILGAYVNATAFNIDEAMIANLFEPKAGAGAGRAPQGMVWGSIEQMPSAWGSGENPMMPKKDINRPIPISNKLLNNTPLQMVSVSTDDNTVDFFIQCIRLPNGVQPPGMY